MTKKRQIKRTPCHFCGELMPVTNMGRHLVKCENDPTRNYDPTHDLRTMLEINHSDLAQQVVIDTTPVTINPINIPFFAVQMEAFTYIQCNCMHCAGNGILIIDGELAQHEVLHVTSLQQFLELICGKQEGDKLAASDHALIMTHLQKG